jgi:hypothetical protein
MEGDQQMSDEYKICSDPVKVFNCSKGGWVRVNGIMNKGEVHVIEYAAYVEQKDCIYELESELTQARSDLSKWKDEYENVCKFATQYEEKAQKLTEANRILRDGLEFYSKRSNWMFTKNLPLPHIGIMRLTIHENDKDIGLLCEGNHDDCGGFKARKALEQADKIMEGGEG